MNTSKNLRALLTRDSLIVLIISGFWILFNPSVFATDWNFRGEATLMTSKVNDTNDASWHLRYLPEIKVRGEEGEQWTWDTHLAGYLYAFDSPTLGKGDDGAIFRAWARVYNDTIEYRLGLQELSFGPATLLRSLQWFDSKTPLDPTSFTKGVKASLIRISTENDSQYWIWGLYNNEDFNVLTSYPSDPDTLEIGGRAQFSEDLGDWAITTHHRTAQLTAQRNVVERRMALDFKLDQESYALWLEGVVIQREAKWPYSNEEHLFTVGLDTTLNILEEGVILTFEKNWIQAKTEETGFTKTGDSNAFMASFSHGLLDSFSLIWINAEVSKTGQTRLDWKRTYDNYLWDLSLFQIKQNTTPDQLGVGLIIQYNH